MKKAKSKEDATRTQPSEMLDCEDLCDGKEEFVIVFVQKKISFVFGF